MAKRFQNIRYLIEYGVFRAVAGLLGALPVETASSLSGALWRLVAPHLRRHERALQNLKDCFPEKSDAERQRIALDMWEGLGRVFAESFHLVEIASSDRVTIEHAGDQIADLQEGQGLVVCAGHQGNWELGVFGLLRNGAEPCGIYQRVKNPYVDQYIRALREPYYPGGLYQKQKSTAMAVMRQVRAGGSVCIMADLRDMQGVKVPFFGRLAPSTPFPALLARSLNVPLFMGQVVRDDGVRFRMRMEPVDVPVTDNREADIEAATASLQAIIERTIRERPEQWMWAHRRWG